MKINLKPNKILVQHSKAGAGTWNISKVLQVSDYVAKIKPGDIIVYRSDEDVVDFSINSEEYIIINPDHIVAHIEDYPE